jgi:hypothetical protein
MYKFFTRLLFCIVIVAGGLTVNAQGKSTLSGFVKDTANGESLLSASIYIVELGKGINTNGFGFYSITVPQGRYTVRISYVGYATQQLVVDLTKDTRLNVNLNSATVEKEEVVITGEKKGNNVESTDMGKQVISMEQVKTIPAFMGEADVIKTLQLLPGIISAGEGNTGFYVRGGSSDQNLVLLDDAVIYNTGHLLGFFSVFNSDALKNTTVITGGMPAEYGGRISSVVDVSMKEGDMKKWDVEGGIGLISSRLTVQGPLKKDKCSIIVSGRRTYIDLITDPILKHIAGGQFAGNAYYFYDLNAKINWRISDRDRLFLSGYYGKDVFNFVDPGGNFKVSFPWGNTAATFRWNHLFSDQLFLNTTLTYNSFGFQANTNFQDVTFNLSSVVQDATAKMQFEYSPLLGHLMKFGVLYSFHTFAPYQTSGSAGSTELATTNQQTKLANEAAIFFQDDFEITNWLKMNIGVRGSLFNFMGPFSEVQFNQYGSALDTLSYRPGQNIKTYFGAEPRLSMRFKVDKTSSIKFGSTLNKQYINLVQSATTTLPIDLWVPATAIVKPQMGLQTSVGYFRNFKDDMFETSVEVYYKYLWHQIEFGESAVPANTEVDVEDQFVFGKGWSYGAEFLAKKVKGKWTGWVSYTLSWAWRKFPAINNDQPFLAEYDRRNDLNVVSMYEINKHWTVSATFVFATGQRTTLPISYYLIEGQINYVYGPRNWYKMPDYDRLDFGFVYKIIPKKKRKIVFNSDITVSVYNAYNRMNPFFLYIDAEGYVGGGSNSASGNTKSISFTARQVSLFPILPSITWNFKF